jgi:hypothetical protein
MANEEHLKILKQSVEQWNKWRLENAIKPDLGGANLSDVNLCGANLSGANLGGANLACADLSGANLSGANLGRANLIDAKLSDADLSNAKLFDANLSDADLSKANLSNAKLRGAILADVDLQGANLTSADLTDADLSRTGLVETDFTNATITGCRTYGASAWNVTLAGTVQNNLVITKEGEPVVTVDDLEVAQFIHLLITNRKIRNVIHSVTSKAVLILGRFSEKQKPVLDALQAALRDSHNLVPILFDWEPSENRDLTETVLLRANMCRFVIADVTDAKSIPQELSVIVPNLPSVAVQPIILASEHEYAMFEHWRKFPAVLSEYRYESQQQLLDTLDTRVLAPIKQWEEATDKTAVKERQMREEIEAQRAEIAKLKRQAAEGGR